MCYREHQTHRMISGPHRAGNLSGASFHRNTSPVAFGGMRGRGKSGRDGGLWGFMGAADRTKCSPNVSQREGGERGGRGQRASSASSTSDFNSHSGTSKSSLRSITVSESGQRNVFKKLLSFL